jgi:hypothetical protein
MKILEKRYPLGTFKGQKTDGRYIDGMLWENIKLLARNIVKDMTYLGIITSSTLEVGTGKSVFAQQIMEAYFESVREYHNIDNTLTMENLVFKPKDVIERAFKVPKYSGIIIDEWEDAHYWSELGMTLRQFFRKCRQLNLFIIIIIPNFFQLNINYAITRSVFLCDVTFSGEFDRGYFSFYSFKSKKALYLLGKKTQNYNCVQSDFTGRFLDGYVVDEAQYRTAKLKDLEEEGSAKERPIDVKAIKVQIAKQFRMNCPEIPIHKLAQGFAVSERTIYQWFSDLSDSASE